jgi:hypothetical protein
MRKLIRLKAFEVNSSSSHSISIADSNKDFVLDALYPDENGIITVNGDSYGWEQERYNSAVVKASYVATQFMYDEDKLDLLKKVIIDQTGAEGVVFNISKDDYIEHESVGIVKAEYDYLRNLIFNKNSWVFTDNDNNTTPPLLHNTPLFKNGEKGIEVIETKPDIRIIFTHKDNEIHRFEAVEKVINTLKCKYEGEYGIHQYIYDYFVGDHMVYLRRNGSVYINKGYDHSNPNPNDYLRHWHGVNSDEDVFYYTSYALYSEINSFKELKKLPKEIWEKEVVEIRYTIEKI